MPMQLIRGLHNLKKQSGCVLTIGNFDGVHTGHQEIIKRMGNSIGDEKSTQKYDRAIIKNKFNMNNINSIKHTVDNKLLSQKQFNDEDCE